MSLTPRKRIGPYEIAALIGEGGMGEVYRATDTNLKRPVAIKVLPEAVATDAERLARFQREAEVLARLNHLNIAQIHGLEKSDGTTALVMELVEGPTLADRIAQGAIPIDDAVPIAKQIADALEAAHEQGIIHRDLKPANIKVRPDGVVKVLDFGLAKAFEPAAAKSSVASLANSPTITSPAMTGVGILLGTAAYMSPEQAKGRPADKRSDIWAFGCVLHEMLTGCRAFDGEDLVDTMVAVRHHEPNWSALPSEVPAPVRVLLERCLHKDRQQRLSDISAARFVLGDLTHLGTSRPDRAGGRSGYSTRWALATAAIAAIAFFAASIVWRSPGSGPAPAVTRFTHDLGTGQRFTNTGRRVITMSPDGRTLAYVANARIWIRDMDRQESRAITGPALSVINPTFSPDGQSVMFFEGGALKRVPVTGGTPVTVCVTPTAPFGLTWTDQDVLFVEMTAAGSPSARARLMRVVPQGGNAEVVAEASVGDNWYGPERLPDNRGVLVSSTQGLAPNRWDQGTVLVILPSGERRTVINGGSDARYLTTGHLLYSVAGVVFAVAFDLQRLETVGTPVPVLEGVARSTPATAASQFSVSRNGTLAYLAGPASAAAGRSLAVFARNGTVSAVAAPTDNYEFPRVSQDGSFVVVGANDGRDSTLWIIDVKGRVDRRRLIVGGRRNRFPVWTPDGQRITFQSDQEDPPSIYWKRADGTGTVERLTSADADSAHVPAAWSPDGDTLLFEIVKENVYSLWGYSRAMRKSVSVAGLRSEAALTPVFSPDGKWLAYHTRELRGGVARDTVWVRPFPINNEVYEVSSEGTSHHPVWMGPSELAYTIGAGQVVARQVTFSPAFTLGKVTILDTLMPTQPPQRETRGYDPLPDGRFVSDAEPSLQPDGIVAAARTFEIDLVLNWFEELKLLLPTR